jgi:glycosyltransferase involved in cell wall biosynthesis
MSSLISIVMATYNGEKYLQEQVDSLLAQNYPSLEFIFVDDASTDRTWELLSSYAATDKRILLIQNKLNQGYRKTFETGILKAQGEFIALSDQDDFWLPSKISELVAVIGDNSLVYSDSELVDSFGNLMGKKMSDLKRQIAYNSPLMYTFGAWAPGHSMLFRKDLLPFALPVTDFVSHDYLIGFAATCVSGIAYLPTPLVHYRQHATNTIGANLNKTSKKSISKKERKALIIARLNLIHERCPVGKNKDVLKKFASACAESSLLNRIQRFRILYTNRQTMLAYKGKSDLGNILYCFKLLISVF